MIRSTPSFIDDRQMVFDRLKVLIGYQSFEAKTLPRLVVTIHDLCRELVIQQDSNYQHDLVMGVLQKSIVHFSSDNKRPDLLKLHRTECRKLDRGLSDGWCTQRRLNRFRNISDLYSYGIKPLLKSNMSLVEAVALALPAVLQHDQRHVGSNMLQVLRLYANDFKTERTGQTYFYELINNGFAREVMLVIMNRSFVQHSCCVII